MCRGLAVGRGYHQAAFAGRGEMEVVLNALTSPADRSIRQGNLMQDEQILLERARLQAAKALVSFIDEDRDVLTPNGCPYNDVSPGFSILKATSPVYALSGFR